MESFFARPDLTIGLALLAGMIAHAVAQHLRMPGIVVLLAAGLLLGPDGAGIIQPATLGHSLHSLVGFAVAVILFDGALNLNVAELRKQGRAIRQMSTFGAIVTALGATIAAHFILRWDPTLSILFGTLVTVTGPTVVGPLLRRIRVQSRIGTLLNAEGIFVDALGAITAVVALEVILGGEGQTVAAGAMNAVTRLGGGFLVGLIGGLLIVGALRVERLIPEGLDKVLTLAFVFALFQFSNALITESGIMAVIMAGLVVGNVRSNALTELKDFKEQVTTMLIGLLFVLLAADVRVDEVRALGWPGVWVVLALMFVVRPLNVFIGTLGTDLKLREKAFVAWMAPRGIVAAAIASLFAGSLDAEGVRGGDQLRAMVFLLIAVTVTVAGITGPIVARILGVRRLSQSGIAILGGNALGRAIARLLKEGREDVVLIDSNPQQCRLAESQGLRVIYGSGVAESVQQRAELDVRAGAIGVTSNDEVNLLFARHARKAFRVPRVWVSLRRGQENVTPKMVREIEGRVLFGQPVSVEFWIAALERNRSAAEAWVRTGEPVELAKHFQPEDEQLVLPMVVQRGKKRFVVDSDSSARRDDVVWFALAPRRRDDAIRRLMDAGWAALEPAETEDPAESSWPVTTD